MLGLFSVKAEQVDFLNPGHLFQKGLKAKCYEEKKHLVAINWI